ncbi:MAG: type II toxin-antitoxin system VapC family toxin [Terracidiphilus sp.]
MIVDSSALIAIVTKEKDGPALARKIDEAARVSMSAATYLETAIVLDKPRDPARSARLDELILDLEMVIEPVTFEQARIARQAYRDYGKGSGHPANLNFGDCFSYALAREKREPILYKGVDFVHTDLRSAV